jgi:hypothetical protein
LSVAPQLKSCLDHRHATKRKRTIRTKEGKKVLIKKKGKDIHNKLIKKKGKDKHNKLIKKKGKG